MGQTFQSKKINKRNTIELDGTTPGLQSLTFTPCMKTVSLVVAVLVVRIRTLQINCVYHAGI